jgi:membrane-bound ClpP family serine protease
VARLKTALFTAIFQSITGAFTLRTSVILSVRPLLDWPIRIIIILPNYSLCQGRLAMSQISWWTTGIVIFIIIGFIAIVISLIVRTYSRKTATGRENLKGQDAVVVETLNPNGVVSVEGELWKAVSNSGLIESGQEVIISEVKGLILSVKNKTKE